jgi:hypothetical protein
MVKYRLREDISKCLIHEQDTSGKLIQWKCAAGLRLAPY